MSGVLETMRVPLRRSLKSVAGESSWEAVEEESTGAFDGAGGKLMG